MATDKSKSSGGRAIEDEFEEVPDSYAEAWKEPTVGDSIAGEYCGARMVRGDRGDQFSTYVVRRDDDTLVSIAGATLTNRMARIPVGTRLRITYKGTEKSNRGTPMKLFSIDMAKGTVLLPVRVGNAQGQADGDIPF